MPILAGIQRRNYVVGKIRAGDKDSSGRPHRLDGFRFTSHSPRRAAEIAEFYQGDKPRPWGPQWEVYTSVREVAVALPPGRLVIDQAMMRWSGGGPTMVCDGVTTRQPACGPCQCPQPGDPDDPESVWDAIKERRRLAGMKTPQGCYPYTWIHICLVDIGDFGVWQLLSKSENAAAEIIQKAGLLERARSAGQFLSATLALEYREARVDGVLRQYNVPAIRIDESVRAIANGQLAGRSLAEQLPPAPGETRLAITAGQRQKATRLTPQGVADLIPLAECREDVEKLQARVEAGDPGLLDEEVYVEHDGVGVQHQLREALRDRWRQFPSEKDAQRAQQEPSDGSLFPPEPQEDGR
jgi:Recombination directionality factor-like